MIKVAFFDTKEYDKASFESHEKATDMEFKFLETKLTEDTAELARGCDAVCVFVNDTVNSAVIDKLYSCGVKIIALRCAGYNNVDVEHAFGKIHVVHVPAYSPYAVAEHAAALLLTSVRRIHKAYNRTRDFNFSINGLTGFDDPAYITVDMKVGRDDPYKVQLPTTAYSYSSNTIVLSASYLNGLKPGMHTFDFWYDMEFGKVIQLSCKVAVYVDYKVTQINAVNMFKSGPMADVNWYQYSGRNLSFTANGDASKFVGVRVDGKLLASTSYMWSGAGAGSTNVQLYPGYLAGLAQGKHVIEILFSDGVATADFAILSGSASPKTSDNNHIALWAGLLVLSGAAVVALIPKKKKQKSR